MSGSGEAVKESFHGVILKQFVERPAVDLGTVEKALPDGCGYVSGRLHRVASR